MDLYTYLVDLYITLITINISNISDIITTAFIIIHVSSLRACGIVPTPLVYRGLKQPTPLSCHPAGQSGEQTQHATL